MVEIADIEDRESLHAWLKGQPRETAVWIASRAAARVLPVWWEALISDSSANMPVLRALLLSSVAATKLTRSVVDAANAFIAADWAANLAEHRIEGEVDQPSSYSVFDIGYAAEHAVYTAVYPNGRHSAYAAGEAASATSHQESYWAVIRLDCEFLVAAEALRYEPLWHDRPNPLQDRWDAVIARLRDDPPPGGPWDFLRDWYQALLDGTPMDPDLLTRIALIAPEDWDAGPERVNPMIAEMVAEHAAARTPNAERIVENPETERLQLEAVSDLPPDRLSEIRAKMLDAAEIFGDRVEGNQPYSALSSEVELVRNAATSEYVRPIRLYDVCRRAVRRTQRKAALGECPENDALIEDWLDQLGEAALDLGEGDRRVQEVIAARAAARLRQASPEEAASARDGAVELAQLSEGELAEELEADADTLADSDASAEDRREAQYRLTSRLTRVWLGARRVLRETREVSGDVAGITLNVAKIVGASAAIKKAVNFLSSLV